MNITTSLEVSKRLKESGYNENTFFKRGGVHGISAPTTSELLEKIGNKFKHLDLENGKWYAYNTNGYSIDLGSDTPPRRPRRTLHTPY